MARPISELISMSLDNLINPMELNSGGITVDLMKQLYNSVEVFNNGSFEAIETNAKFGRLFLDYGIARIMNITYRLLEQSNKVTNDIPYYSELATISKVLTPDIIEKLDVVFTRTRGRIDEFKSEIRPTNKTNKMIINNESTSDILGYYLEALHYIIKGSIISISGDSIGGLLDLFDTEDYKLAPKSKLDDYFKTRIGDKYDNLSRIINTYSVILLYITKSTGYKMTDPISKLSLRISGDKPVNNLLVDLPRYKFIFDGIVSDLTVSDLEEPRTWIESNNQSAFKIVLDWVNAPLFDYKGDKVKYTNYKPYLIGKLDKFMKTGNYTETSDVQLIKSILLDDYNVLTDGVNGCVKTLIENKAINIDQFDKVIEQAVSMRLMLSADSPLRSADATIDKFDNIEDVVENAIDYIESVLHTLVLLWFYSGQTFLVDTTVGGKSVPMLNDLTKKQVFISLVRYYEAISYIDYKENKEIPLLKNMTNITKAANIMTFTNFDQSTARECINILLDVEYGLQKINIDTFKKVIKKSTEQLLPVALIPFLLETNTTVNYSSLDTFVDYSIVSQFIKAVDREEANDEMKDYDRSEAMIHFLSKFDTEAIRIMFAQNKVLEELGKKYPNEYFIIKNFLLISTIINYKKQFSTGIVTFGIADTVGYNYMTDIIFILNNVIKNDRENVSLLSSYMKTINV